MDANIRLEDKLNKSADKNSIGDGLLIEGKNAVLECLKSGRFIDKLYISSEHKVRIHDIVKIARENGIVISECNKKKLDSLSITGSHQGVIASVAAKDYVGIDDILKIAEDRGQAPLIIICDGITDPYNFGAILRSAEALGAHGVIIAKRRSAPLNAVCAKASAGALEHIAIAKVSNISSTIIDIKKRGIWVFAADISGDSLLYNTDMKGATAIVLGAEGEGLGKSVLEKCDYIVKIPMSGKMNSLNVSVSAAIIINESMRQRSV